MPTISSLQGAFTARRALGSLLAGVLLSAMSAGTLTAQTVTTFDATPTSTDTFPTAINTSGTIAGYYFDNTNAHGFVRDTSGNITTFNDPNDSPTNGTTTVFGMNDAGTVVGTYNNAVTSAQMGYIRAANGTFTDVRPSGATLTTLNSININGLAAGTYIDGANTAHCFVFDSSTSTTSSCDVAGAASISVAKINSSNVVAGFYTDSAGVTHGFTSAKGKASTFDAPAGSVNMQVTDVSDGGTVVGFYTPDNLTYHSFLWIPNGSKIATFDGSGPGTYAAAINGSDTIVGNTGSNTMSYGFIHTSGKGPLTKPGAISMFSVPGSVSTEPQRINDSGAIAGIAVTYDGTTYSHRGFVRQ